MTTLSDRLVEYLDHRRRFGYRRIGTTAAVIASLCSLCRRLRCRINHHRVVPGMAETVRGAERCHLGLQPESRAWLRKMASLRGPTY